MQSIFNSRNLMIFVTLVAGIIIGASIAAENKKDPVPLPKEDEVDMVDDAVNVVVLEKALLIPNRFKAILKSLGIAGIALVDDKATLRAVTMDGLPIDLCGPGKDAKSSDRTCRLRISTSRLIARLAGSAPNALATCPGLCAGQDDFQHECHKTGRRKNKYDCNDPAPTRCASTCQ